MVTLQEVDYFDIGINAEKIREEKLTFICARERDTITEELLYAHTSYVSKNFNKSRNKNCSATQYKNETFSHVIRKKKIKLSKRSSSNN